MSMGYEEFKEYLATFLWKSTDTVLIANLDNLIKMAEHELNRTLLLAQTVTATTFISTAPNVSLRDILSPFDFRAIKSLTTSKAVYSASTSAHVSNLLASNTTNKELPFYWYGQEKIFFATNYSDDNPSSEFTMTYRTKVPDFQASVTPPPGDGDEGGGGSLGESWLADDYLDVYVYTTLKHTAGFLREDERVALWINLADTAVASANEFSAFNQDYGGSPTHMQAPKAPTPAIRR